MNKRILLFLAAASLLPAAPTPAAVSAFKTYVKAVETRLATQHQSPVGFLAPKEIIEHLTPSPSPDFAGAMLHHWRGTAIAPGARVADFETLLRDFNSYPQVFSPEVLQAKVLAEGGDRIQAWMRVRQRHIVTVVMDTAYDITFGRLDAQHGYSISRSTRISEIDSPGAGSERALHADEEHGFLWRLNTYWSYEEKDARLYLQIEAVSLTRGIPTGLGWMIRPFVESIPRDSLGFTLRSVCNALQK